MARHRTRKGLTERTACNGFYAPLIMKLSQNLPVGVSHPTVAISGSRPCSARRELLYTSAGPRPAGGRAAFISAALPSYPTAHTTARARACGNADCLLLRSV